MGSIPAPSTALHCSSASRLGWQRRPRLQIQREATSRLTPGAAAGMAGPSAWPDVFLVGGKTTPLKNDGVRQLGLLFPIYGEKNVPNHQPGFIVFLHVFTISGSSTSKHYPLFWATICKTHPRGMLKIHENPWHLGRRNHHLIAPEAP